MENYFTFTDFFNPEALIRYGGLTLLLVIVFAESGLFLGFFLPGDSLLFVAGLMSDSKHLDTPVVMLWLMLIAAAVVGAQVGFWFGKKAGNYLANKKDSLFYKKKYLEITRSFYIRHGKWAFILGRFLPIVRTFIPILAGLVEIDFKVFSVFNVLGGVLWVSVMFYAGYGLGNMFPNLSDHLELIVAGMILVSTTPVWIAVYRQNRILKGQV